MSMRMLQQMQRLRTSAPLRGAILQAMQRTQRIPLSFGASFVCHRCFATSPAPPREPLSPTQLQQLSQVSQRHWNEPQDFTPTAGYNDAKAAAASPPASGARKKPQIIILAGPTGIGKTRLSLELARHLNGEIVSADSVQQYRGMDIGSAKVGVDVRARVPHHCIDTASVSSPVTVDFFSSTAHRAIRSIVARKKVPIVVGGSGFYLRWLIKPGVASVITPEMRKVVEDIDGMPHENKFPADLTLDQLVAEWSEKVDRLPEAFRLKEDGKKHFLEQLRTHPQAKLNRQWVRKTLEMMLANSGLPPPEYTPPSIADLRASEYDWRCFYLTCDREWLNRWTDLRCEQMVRSGFLKEVKRLEIMQHLSEKPTLAAAVGYRQALVYLKKFILPFTSLVPPAEPSSPSSSKKSMKPRTPSLPPLPPALVPSLHAFPYFLASFQSASRSLIRTQDIWFRKETFYQFLPLRTPPVPSEGFGRKAGGGGGAGGAEEFIREYSVGREEWKRMERNILAQLQLSEEAYWSHPQWSIFPPPPSDEATTLASGWADPAFEWKKVLKSDEEMEEETRQAEREATDTLGVMKSLPFQPSAALQASIQQLLRAQTNLGAKPQQRLRRAYVSHAFLYGGKQQRAMEQAVMEAVVYDPHSEKDF